MNTLCVIVTAALSCTCVHYLWPQTWLQNTVSGHSLWVGDNEIKPAKLNEMACFWGVMHCVLFITNFSSLYIPKIKKVMFLHIRNVSELWRLWDNIFHFLVRAQTGNLSLLS